MTEPDDRELRDRFQALRREDARGAPPFEATLARARARTAVAPRPWAGGVATAAALVAALVLARFLLPGGRRGAATDLASVRWEAPTDFLLVLPGADLLRAVPALGRMPNFHWRTL